jgi:hypothetical protein
VGDDWESVPTKDVEYPLPDGGKVVVADTRDFAEMGDGFACRNATYQRGGVEIAWELRDGVPQCVSVKLQSDGLGLRTKDLHNIRLDDVREIVYSAIGIGTFTPDGEEYEMAPVEARKAVNRAATRRKITTELVRKVAEIHRAAPEGRRIAAVEAAFGVHERTALRYIAEAKQKGFIHG